MKSEKMKIIGKFGNIDILAPSCNLSTINDGRGGIFTWVPDHPILEFNLLYFHPNKVRGNHYHPEFIESFLVVEASGVLITQDPDTKKPITLHVAKGSCIRSPINTPQAFRAITSATCVSLLTKPWDDCDKPIIHEPLAPFDQEYVDYAKKEGIDYPKGPSE